MPDSIITRSALAVSLKKLMAEKPFAKISIGDICAHCGMNRRSFYYHFQDKYDLAIWIYNTEFLDRMYRREYDSTWAFFLDLCTYFHENRGFYLELFSVTGQNSFREYFTEVFTPLFYEALKPEFENERHASFFAEFYADALIISLEKWLHKNALAPLAYVELLQAGIQSAAQRVMRGMAEQAPPEASPGE